MDDERGSKKKRGPKGGIQHQPGRGHDRKSALRKKQRFQIKRLKQKQAELRDIRQQWKAWDNLPAEVRKLRPELEPKNPRPTNED